MKDFRIEGTTINHFDYLQNYLTIDLHNCESAVALRVIRSRLQECYNFGIKVLEVVHGHPKSKFSLVDALRHVLREQDAREVLIGCIPLNELGYMSGGNHTATRLLLKDNPKPAPQDNRMSFSGFCLKYSFDEEDIPRYAPFIAETPEYGYSFNLLAQTIFNYGLAVPNGVSSQHSAALESALAAISAEIPSSQATAPEGFTVTYFQVSRPVFKKLISMLKQPLSMQEEAARVVGCPEELCMYASTLLWNCVPVRYPLGVFYFSVRDEVGEPSEMGFTKLGLEYLRSLWKQSQKRGLQYPPLAKQRFKSEPFMLNGERILVRTDKEARIRTHS